MLSRVRMIPDESNAAVPLSPLVDVAMILLVFFVVVTLFCERVIPAERAMMRGCWGENEQVNLRVANDGSLWIRGESVDLESLRYRIEELVAVEPEAPFILFVEDKVTAGTMVSALDQIHLGGATSVAVTQSTTRWRY